MNLSIHDTLQNTALSTTQLSCQIQSPHLPASTKRIAPIAYFLGQQRAEQALNLGLDIGFTGHHICVVGEEYLSKAEQILQFLQHKYRTQNIPIIYEQYPTLHRLFGELFINKQGELQSVQHGTLQNANGGILILDLAKIFAEPQTWALLKHAIKHQVWQWNTLPKISSLPLQLDDITLNLKVILLANSEQYDELFAIDSEFAQLFKIRADFQEQLKRDAEQEQAYLAWITHFVQRYQLLPLNRNAFVELLKQSSRQIESQHYLSLNVDFLSSRLQQAHYFAQQQHADMIDASHLQLALQQHIARNSYWKDLYWQELQQGTLLIATQGYRLGQVNALSVIQYSDDEFGVPSRLTATVSQGGGDILDIERSVELGGALHAKATLLMSSFLKSHFGRQFSLNFSAAIAFEQSYGEIDGDSATVAELSALISAISQIPIHQAWAITGSMNQLGQIQPVGGINAKIEGFFDVCCLQGLTGQQGVIIPRQNIQHLVLRDDVIQAVAEKKFHIHAIDTIEQALELLMNRPIGRPDKKGRYPEGSIYHAVIQQFEQWQVVEHGEELSEVVKKTKKKK